LHSQFLIGGYACSQELSQTLTTRPSHHNYRISIFDQPADFLEWISQNRHRVDCLVFDFCDALPEILATLQNRDILLPVVIVEATTSEAPKEALSGTTCARVGKRYHHGSHCIKASELSEIEQHIHTAITQFLTLPHNQVDQEDKIPSLSDTRHFLLSLQQQRLTEKLKERLGYLGVYYKRNSENFIRNLSLEERTKVIEELRMKYREIVLAYFRENSDLNKRIDDFVNVVFFTDISVSKVVEIHMELMDSFSKQLKLEGRSEEILLDYRLTLIDVIAHLCEMYRRSIPREN